MTETNKILAVIYVARLLRKNLKMGFEPMTSAMLY